MRRGMVLALLGALTACNPYGSDGVSPSHPVFAPAMAPPLPKETDPKKAATAAPEAKTTAMSASAPVPMMAPMMSPAAPPPAPAPEPPAPAAGWQGVRWGASRDEVRKVLTGAGEMKEKVGKTERTVFGLADYALPGCPSRAVMEFDGKGGLQAVRVVARGPVDGACLARLRQGLAEKYGAPEREERPRGSLDIHNASWRSKDGGVALTSSLDGKGQGLFQIAYASPSAPAPMAPGARVPDATPSAELKARL